jgi:monomeric sarcosine oxidase
MAQHFDVIVLGTGGVGTAALWQLAQRGVSVLGLDRFPPGHDRGSSHGQTRIIRQAYFEHPDYVPLLKRAYQLWEDIEQQSGRRLFYKVGLAQIGLPDSEVIAGVTQSAAQHTLPLERWSAKEATQRLPGFVIPPEMVVAFEANAGYLLVEDCVRTQAELAARHGARLEAGHTVQNWRRDGNRLVITTDRETFTADRLVITAGAWAADLLKPCVSPLTVLRKPLYWLKPISDVYGAANGCPAFLYDLGGDCYYGFPQIDAAGVKVARHSGGEVVVDPLTVNRELNPEDFAQVTRYTKQFLPDLSAECLRHETCLYTMSPDGHFIVDRAANDPHVFFAAGLSGHGFKFVPVLGEILADLALTGQTLLPARFLSADRFKNTA